MDSKKLLHKEQFLAPVTFAILVTSAITGLVIYIADQHTIWLQWTILTHLLTGIGLSPLMLLYLKVHFQRTIGFRRTSVLLSGLLSVAILIGFSASGWDLLLHGQRQNKQWVYQLHVICSSLFVAIVIAHIILHVVSLPKKRRNVMQLHFSSLSKLGLTSILCILGSFPVLIIALSLVYSHSTTPYSQEPAVRDYEYAYGEHRFRPSQTETSNGAFIDKRQIATSGRCLSCHEDITKQWLSSVHQQAASDPTYVTNITLLADKKGISATRYCEGCHAPVALLSGELSPGGDHGGIEGSIANIEGVSCMSCHGISSLPHLKGVASYEFTPAQDYLFANSDHPLLLRLHDLLVRVKPDQHKQDVGRPLLQDPKICAACHTQFMDKEMNGWGWIKMQDEYSAWLASPFSKQEGHNFSDSTVSRCQNCHMPLIASNDPSANDEGKVRSHHFPGANTFLLLLRGDHQQFEAVEDFLQSNKMRVSIEKPKRKDAIQTLHALDETLRDFEEAPFFYYLGEQANLNIVVSNRGVGHDFPGGTIDINEAWVDILVMDTQGDQVYRSGFINNDNHVDPNAYFYRSLPVDRSGNLVWKHDLFNMVGESFRRTIKAGASDVVDVNFTVPAWVKSPLTVTATLKYRKLNERYARWALKDQYIKIPVIDLAWDSLSIPIKHRKEVE